MFCASLLLRDTIMSCVQCMHLAPYTFQIHSPLSLVLFTYRDHNYVSRPTVCSDYGVGALSCCPCSRCVDWKRDTSVWGLVRGVLMKQGVAMQNSAQPLEAYAREICISYLSWSKLARDRHRSSCPSMQSKPSDSRIACDMMLGLIRA
jgi:hypothetical protein